MSEVITKAAQGALMKFDPANGGARPYPSDADQWRQFHGIAMAWMFNPWTGTQRTPGDVDSDPHGLLICPPGGQLYAETRLPEARSISDEMMDCVDRLGSQFDSVDPRVWGHLLVYAPDDKVMERARAALSHPAPSPQPAVPVVSDERLLHEWDRVSRIAEAGSRRLAFARAILALRPQAVPMTLPQVEGDVLPPVGSKVLIHLASSDSWAEHEVVGYYVWEAINELAKPRHHRVFVRVRDSDGILNARHLCDVRGITAKAEGGAKP